MKSAFSLLLTFMMTPHVGEAAIGVFVGGIAAGREVSVSCSYSPRLISP